eukprot:TRINITY_DN38834_c0_g1_i1.p2 TRINITY_DN38834_c0_g1~~TRINITY_DN38834_c0_g1_i1.p2  ORF type:complete len:188 (+),score=60.94 TRINITY_DN38834_c0_g1_i1:184-747(+)
MSDGKHPDKPNGDWLFCQKTETSIREIEFELKLWEDGAFEHMYSTTVKGVQGSLHRRGQWCVGQGRLFCHVEGQCRITRQPKAPPSVAASPLAHHEQLTFDICVNDGTLTGSDPTPVGKAVLGIQLESLPIADLHAMGEFAQPPDVDAEVDSQIRLAAGEVREILPQGDVLPSPTEGASGEVADNPS